MVRALGMSGVDVSAIGLGGYELGDGVNLTIERAREIVTASLDAGVNWIDTAEVYLDTRNETAIGEAIVGIRDELIVATKVAPAPDGTGLRPEQIEAACRASLKRLRTDRIDVYVVHWPDEDGGVPLAETWGGMARLVDEGLVRAIGLSNYGMADIETCHASRPVDVIQQGLSLIDHEEERPVVARCGELGIAAVIYEPLAGGVLTGALTRETGHEQWGPEWHDSRFYRRLFAGDRLDQSVAFVDRSGRWRSLGGDGRAGGDRVGPSPAGRHVGDLWNVERGSCARQRAVRRPSSSATQTSRNWMPLRPPLPRPWNRHHPVTA